jgi:hypothetical protein
MLRTTPTGLLGDVASSVLDHEFEFQTLKLVFSASNIKQLDQRHWLQTRIMCQSGARC